MRWDLFCSVVDNLGDIGVCWRLARQLAAEHAADVRLWVDDLATFRRLAPALDVHTMAQRLGDIDVRAWKTPFPLAEPADIVVETFGCELPAAYVDAMAKRQRAPVWINLEYLSAESWVDGCHGLPSPHPQLPLVKYFFFPGFTARTGGVLIEPGLSRRRQVFQRDAATMRRFLDGLEVNGETEGEILLSLFCYPQAPLTALLEAFAAGSQPIRVISFDGTPGAQALDAFGVGGGRRRGALAGKILPFLPRTTTTGCCGPATGISCVGRTRSCVLNWRDGRWCGRPIPRLAMLTGSSCGLFWTAIPIWVIHRAASTRYGNRGTNSHPSGDCRSPGRNAWKVGKGLKSLPGNGRHTSKHRATWPPIWLNSARNRYNLALFRPLSQDRR